VKPSITDTFNKELNAAMFDSNVLGLEASKSKKEFEIKEDGERHNYKPLEFLKDGESLSEILSLVKNKKISKNKIRTGIKKLLKNPEDLNNFLQSILDGRTKKEENKEASVSGAGVGMFLGQLSGEEPKKVETKEAAVSGGGVGAYETPKAWAKSTSKKDWRGKSKTQIPGGTFVQVKKKCKSFPYCNQGDTGALNFYESENIKTVIKNVSHKYGLSENEIREIIFKEIKTNR
jgi:hypothetical protein